MVDDFKTGREKVVPIASSRGEHWTHTHTHKKKKYTQAPWPSQRPELQARVLSYRRCRCSAYNTGAALLLLKFRASVGLYVYIVLSRARMSLSWPAIEIIIVFALIPSVGRQESLHTRTHTEAPSVAATKGRA